MFLGYKELTWGMTLSQVSMETMLKPSCRAASTSGSVPWENHSVNSRRMSCKLLPLAARPAPAGFGNLLCLVVLLTKHELALQES